MSLNVAVIVGNIAREVNLHESANGKAFCNMIVATNDGWGENKTTSFISVKAFGKTAENCAKYLTKGSKVGVEGFIQTGSYEKQDGTKVYTTDVIANRVEFMSKASDGEQTSMKVDNSIPEGFHEVQDECPF